MPVPNSFANVTTSIPLSQLDANFNTPITLGNTAIQLGNTVSTLNNMTLANVTVTSGNVTITNVSVTTANVTTANIATANIATEIVTTSQTLNYGTANAVVYLNGSKVSTTGTALQFDGTNLGLGVTPSAWESSWKAFDIGSTGTVAFGFGEIDLGNNFYRLNTGAYRYKASSTPASNYVQSAGVHSWYTAGSGTAGNAITFTQIMAVEGGKSLALQGATTQTGTGITFPAAVNPSSDVNTLDDYEEGDWTPTVRGSSTAGTTTYGAQRVGRYTKVGRQVTCTFRVNYTAATGTGDLWIIGFPFVALEAIGTAMTDNLNWPNAGSLNWYIAGGTTGVLFISQDDAAWNLAQLSNEAADIIGTITYFV